MYKRQLYHGPRNPLPEEYDTQSVAAMLGGVAERVPVSYTHLDVYKRQGARLAGALSPGAVVAYRGGLGMGKTAFTRGLARGLGYVGRVTSPTFTIVNEYEGCLLYTSRCV